MDIQGRIVDQVARLCKPQHGSRLRSGGQEAGCGRRFAVRWRAPVANFALYRRGCAFFGAGKFACCGAACVGADLSLFVCLDPCRMTTVAAAPRSLVIATRESRLALWQAEHVRALLQALYPECQVSLLGMTTKGDRILDRTLSKVGGKGLFIKELEAALLDGRADLAVHSLKDVPVELDDTFAMPCILPRADPRDALVAPRHASLAELPPGGVVGTSSLRREAQVRARYPHLEVRPLRGNLDTRLRKLDQGEYDAIILATVGLQRLGLQARIASELPVEDSLPAAGQGALGIEVAADRTDLVQWLAPLVDADATAVSVAERAVSRRLGGSCQVPLAAYAELNGSELHIRGLVARPDGRVVLRAERRGSRHNAEALGQAVADQLLKEGAGEILAELDPAGRPE